MSQGKRLSYRRPLVFAALSIISLISIPLRWIYLHNYDQDVWLNILNFIVVAIPFAFSIVFAFVPDMRSRHIAWRALVIFIGLAFSWALWKQQHLAADATRKDEKDAVNTAVQKSNEHSDSELSKLKDELDQTRSDLGGRIDKMPDLLSKTEAHLDASIGKMGAIPDKHPTLELSFWGDDMGDLPLTQTAILPENGTFPVQITAKNNSDTEAKDVEIWIHICKACSFTKEPRGFDRPAGTDAWTRHKFIPILNSGVWIEPIPLDISVASPYRRFTIGFSYSCATCGKVVTENDVLTVTSTAPKSRFGSS